LPADTARRVLGFFRDRAKGGMGPGPASSLAANG
jgi:hypothetical protein